MSLNCKLATVILIFFNNNAKIFQVVDKGRVTYVVYSRCGQDNKLMTYIIIFITI